jgi:predicted FMN-binding regulatory protein PaiB
LAILSPITLTPGNLPTITSSSVKAEGEITNFEDDDVVSLVDEQLIKTEANNNMKILFIIPLS